MFKDRLFFVQMCLDRGRKIEDRARWGVSGALSPTIRYSGVESPVEAALCLACVSVSGVEG